MTNEEILRKAIKKAVKGGWDYKHQGFNYMYSYMSTVPYVINGFIFSHDFAKAFWGEKKLHHFPIPKDPMEEQRAPKVVNEGWQHHLQQIVLEPEPLKYLEKFL